MEVSVSFKESVELLTIALIVWAYIELKHWKKHTRDEDWL